LRLGSSHAEVGPPCLFWIANLEWHLAASTERRSNALADTRVIIPQLHSFARGYATGRGYVIGDGADNDLLRYLKNNKAEIGRRYDADPKAAQADSEGGLTELIDTMIRARRTVYNEQELRMSVIGERTFGWAINKLCPLFPVC
jgi:hypothetical protein